MCLLFNTAVKVLGRSHRRSPQRWAQRPGSRWFLPAETGWQTTAGWRWTPAGTERSGPAAPPMEKKSAEEGISSWVTTDKDPNSCFISLGLMLPFCYKVIRIVFIWSGLAVFTWTMMSFLDGSSVLFNSSPKHNVTPHRGGSPPFERKWSSSDKERRVKHASTANVVTSSVSLCVASI